MQTWWNVLPEKVHEEVKILTHQLRENSQQHTQDLLKAFRLYGNFEARGIAPGNYFRPNVGRNNRLTLNVVKSCVDTVVARVAKSLPKPTFLTSGGSWSQQKKAKQLDKWTGGIFYETNFDRTGRRTFRDATVFGKGIVKIVEDGRSRVAIERVFPDEILVDEMESVDGRPRQMHQARPIARDLLLGMFADDPKALLLIKKAKAADLGSSSQRQVETADLIAVVESWHLPSSPVEEYDGPDYDEKKPELYREAQMKGHDGRHAISIENGCLLYEAWRDDYFPFVWLDWSEALRGFWPVGLPIELIGIQYELNKILRKIQESIDWCVPKMFVESTTKVVLSHLDDVIGGIIRYSGGVPPTLQAWDAVSPQLFEQMERLIRQAYEISGISQLSASAKKPAGLESGAALREYHDIESERFAMIGVAYESFVIEVAKQCIRLARKIALRDGSYAVTAPMKKRVVQRIDWADIDLEDQDFVMQVFPSSALPKTPAGRLAMVQDLMNLGFLDKEDVLRLLDFPDLEAVNALNEAAAEFTNMQIEAMVEKGEPQTPQPYQNLQYALKHAQAAYLLASTMDVPETHLDLLREYMKEIDAMLSGPPMPQGAPAPGAQPGIPGGPPTMPAPGMPVASPPPAAGPMPRAA